MMWWPHVISLAFLLGLAVLAFNSADTDERRFSKGLPPEHRKNLIKRLCIGAAMLALAIIAWALLVPLSEAASTWRALWLAPIGLGWFDAMFRLLLNLMRDKPWWYLGPSYRGPDESAIDTGFWMLAYGFWVNEGDHREFYATGMRAGVLAYVLDAVLVIGGAVLAHL